MDKLKKDILFVRNKLLTLKAERTVNKRPITDRDIELLIIRLDNTYDLLK